MSGLSSLSPVEVVYLWGPLPIRRDFCPEDKVPHEEETPPLESRRLKSTLREVCFEEGRPRQSKPWVLGMVVVLEYTVRKVKMRVHVALLVDGINEVDELHNISLRVLVGTFFMRTFMWTSREEPAEETALASTTRKARCWCLARTFTSTVSLFLKLGPIPDHSSGDIASWYMNGIASRG